MLITQLESSSLFIYFLGHKCSLYIVFNVLATYSTYFIPAQTHNLSIRMAARGFGELAAAV